MIGRLIQKLYTRRCRGNCEGLSPHTHHLTWLGNLRYTGTVCR